jgi:hypothetical protein
VVERRTGETDVYIFSQLDGKQGFILIDGNTRRTEAKEIGIRVLMNAIKRRK